MGSVYVLVLIAALSSHCSAYAVSHSETDISTSSVILKEGQSAEITCMTKGTGDYFWRKGETLHNSTLVAFFTVGEVSDDSQPYSVTENGTLHIRSVMLKDEGNYFCRVSSAENECYGEVKILVQASLRNFDLAIDRCDGKSSCLLYLDPSQFTSLTCTALNAPPLMTLKWFNGAKEIIEGIEQKEILTQNGNSREITSTVTAVYGHPASLTCQAVDPKRSNDDVRFAHAQVKMTVPVHESLATWIIVAGTLAGCFIVYVIFSLIKAWANRKKYKTKNEEQVNLLTVAKDEVISQLKLSADAKDTEISKLKLSAVAKDTEISNLKSTVDAKNTEISDLKGELKQKDAEVMVKENKNIELQGNLTEISNKLSEIENHLKETLKAKDSELWKIGQVCANLKGDLAKKQRELNLAKVQKSSERSSNNKQGQN